VKLHTRSGSGAFLRPHSCTQRPAAFVESVPLLASTLYGCAWIPKFEVGVRRTHNWDPCRSLGEAALGCRRQRRAAVGSARTQTQVALGL